MKYRLSVEKEFGVLSCEAEDRESFLEGLQSMPNLIESASSILSKTEFPKDGYPHISKPESIADAIIKLLSTSWGKEKPRTLAELHSTLKINAVHVSKENLGSILTRLTKEGKIRRIKENGGFAYFLPL